MMSLDMKNNNEIFLNGIRAKGLYIDDTLVWGGKTLEFDSLNDLSNSYKVNALYNTNWIRSKDGYLEGVPTINNLLTVDTEDNYSDTHELFKFQGWKLGDDIGSRLINEVVDGRIISPDENRKIKANFRESAYLTPDMDYCFNCFYRGKYPTIQIGGGSYLPWSTEIQNGYPEFNGIDYFDSYIIGTYGLTNNVFLTYDESAALMECGVGIKNFNVPASNFDMLPPTRWGIEKIGADFNTYLDNSYSQLYAIYSFDPSGEIYYLGYDIDAQSFMTQREQSELTYWKIRPTNVKFAPCAADDNSVMLNDNIIQTYEDGSVDSPDLTIPVYTLLPYYESTGRLDQYLTYTYYDQSTQLDEYYMTVPRVPIVLYGSMNDPQCYAYHRETKWYSTSIEYSRRHREFLYENNIFSDAYLPSEKIKNGFELAARDILINDELKLVMEDPVSGKHILFTGNRSANEPFYELAGNAWSGAIVDPDNLNYLLFEHPAYGVCKLKDEYTLTTIGNHGYYTDSYPDRSVWSAAEAKYVDMYPQGDLGIMSFIEFKDSYGAELTSYLKTTSLKNPLSKKNNKFKKEHKIIDSGENFWNGYNFENLSAYGTSGVVIGDGDYFMFYTRVEGSPILFMSTVGDVQGLEDSFGSPIFLAVFQVYKRVDGDAFPRLGYVDPEEIYSSTKPFSTNALLEEPSYYFTDTNGTVIDKIEIDCSNLYSGNTNIEVEVQLHGYKMKNNIAFWDYEFLDSQAETDYYLCFSDREYDENFYLDYTGIVQYGAYLYNGSRKPKFNTDGRMLNFYITDPIDRTNYIPLTITVSDNQILWRDHNKPLFLYVLDTSNRLITSIPVVFTNTKYGGCGIGLDALAPAMSLEFSYNGNTFENNILIDPESGGGTYIELNVTQKAYSVDDNSRNLDEILEGILGYLPSSGDVGIAFYVLDSLGSTILSDYFGCYLEDAPDWFDNGQFDFNESTYDRICNTGLYVQGYGDRLGSPTFSDIGALRLGVFLIDRRNNDKLIKLEEFPMTIVPNWMT